MGNQRDEPRQGKVKRSVMSRPCFDPGQSQADPQPLPRRIRWQPWERLPGRPCPAGEPLPASHENAPVAAFDTTPARGEIPGLRKPLMKWRTRQELNLEPSDP